MKIFIWRHSKKFSSWSMFDEPHICKDNYMEAKVIVVANSKEEALETLGKDDYWNIDEIERIEPRVIPATEPAIVEKLIT